MSCYLGSVRFIDGAEIMFDRESIDECKIVVENYICELPKEERKFRSIYIRQFPSWDTVAQGEFFDGKVYWESVDCPGYFFNTPTRVAAVREILKNKEVTEDGRFDK